MSVFFVNIYYFAKETTLKTGWGVFLLIINVAFVGKLFVNVNFGRYSI